MSFQKTGGHFKVNPGRCDPLQRANLRSDHPGRGQTAEHDGRPLRLAVDRHRRERHLHQDRLRRRRPQGPRQGQTRGRPRRPLAVQTQGACGAQ